MWVNVKEDGEKAGREKGRRQEVDKVYNQDNNVTIQLTTEISPIKKSTKNNRVVKQQKKKI